MTSDASAQPVSPAWLTDVLRRAGVLAAGAVIGVEQRANAAFNSNLAHLVVTYSADATSAPPRRLVLKRNLPAPWAVKAGAREVAFYRAMAPFSERLAMLVPCYDAAFDRATGKGHLLLLDVSETHRQPLTRDQQLAPGASSTPWHGSTPSGGTIRCSAGTWRASGRYASTRRRLRITASASPRRGIDS